MNQTLSNTSAMRLKGPNTPLVVLNGAQTLAMQFPAREWLLTGLLKERQMMMLYAPSGVGKSWFAWSMACAVAGAGKFHTYESGSARKVLYLDGEMDAEDAQERLKVCIEASSVSRRVLVTV